MRAETGVSACTALAWIVLGLARAGRVPYASSAFTGISLSVHLIGHAESSTSCMSIVAVYLGTCHGVNDTSDSRTTGMVAWESRGPVPRMKGRARTDG